MSEPGRIDSIAAASTLASSTRVRGAAVWVATFVLLPAFTGVVGWGTGKLDTKLQVDALSGKVDVLSGQVVALVSQQQDLVKAIAGLTAVPIGDQPGGPIFQLRMGMRYAHRDAILGQAMALAAERDKRQKIAAAKTLGDAFDHKVDVDRKSPADAAELVLTQIAVQP